MMTTQTRTTCRSCAGSIYSIFDLGKIVPSDFLLPDQPDPHAVPLDLCRCESCGLVQLKHTVNPDSLYRNYWYRSGINETMKAELADLVQAATTLVNLKPDDVVVDVGANDGTLLSNYPKNVVRIAYEPAYNLFDALRPHADVLVADFFPPKREGLPAKSARIIHSVAMFYDLDDPRAFVAEIDRVLAEDGVWIVQFQDLAQQVQTGAFDNIVAEHLCYYSVQTFWDLLKDANLTVVQAERRAINGGSVRLSVRRRSYAIPVRIHPNEDHWTSVDALERFAWRAGQTRSQLQELIGMAVAKGPVDLYAASTKSSTLLQYCGIDHTLIRQAVERTAEKVGRVTSGTRIPIVNEHTWRMDPSPITIVGAWQFAEAFMTREQEYLTEGGQFLVPLPTVRLVSAAKELIRG